MFSVAALKQHTSYPSYRKVPSLLVPAKSPAGPWHSVMVGWPASCASRSSFPRSSLVGRLTIAPLVGYLPGKVPWTIETRLRELGANVTGSEKGTVLVDRELITGDSPAAENKIAAVAIPALVAFAEKAKNEA